MLVIGPVRALVKLWPLLLISLIASAGLGRASFCFVGVVVVAVLGAVRWFTVSFRVGDTHVELRRNLVRRSTLTVPRSRIRSMEVESTLLHRLFGLTVVRLGSGLEGGDGSEEIVLDSLRTAQALRLRQDLLAGDGPSAGCAPSVPARARAGESVIVGWSPTWLRYAPLSMSGFVVVLGALASIWRYSSQVDRSGEERASSAVANALAGLGITWASVLAIVVLIVVSSVLATLRAYVTYGDLVITQDETALHLRHGLTDKREQTFDLGRLRGATLAEPLTLRLFGAASLQAVMTGLKPSRSQLLPPSPATVGVEVLGKVFGADVAGRVALRGHGRVATRRRWVRALAVPAAFVMFLVVRAAVDGPPPWGLWLSAALLVMAMATLAWDRCRGLGHHVDRRWLVVRSGSWQRRSDYVATAGIIGWVVRQNPFQRRAGVATLVAVAAGGKMGYHVVDVPEALAWSIAATASAWVADSGWARGAVTTERSAQS
jgi:putative membrane protein